MNSCIRGRSLSAGFLTALTALGLAGTAAFAPSAQAQLHPPNFYDEICPPLVSVSYCSNPNNQTDFCWGYNGSACAQTLRNAFDAEYHRLTTTPTPSGESPHGTYSILLPSGMTNGGKLTQGARVSYNQSSLRFVDYDLSYSSTVAIRQRAINFGQFDLNTMTANTSPLHPEWETDGNAINDTDTAHGGHPCAEYVYKKYYDYSRWEDAAASCKSDWICIYNLGVSLTRPGVGFYPLLKKQGTRMTVQLPINETQLLIQPKNGFWKINVVDFSDFIAYRNRMDVANAIGPAARQVQPYTIASRWVWHTTMHQQQARENLTLAEYQDMEVRQKTITDLYNSFVATRDSLAGAPGGRTTIWQAMNPYTILQTHCLTLPTIDINGNAHCSQPTNTLPVFPTNSAAEILRVLAGQITDALIAEWDHRSYADGTTVDHGCLDPGSNRCDWQPKMFAQEFTGLFGNEREKDFQTCLDKTGEVFSTANYPPMYPADHSDTDHLESWMAAATNLRNQLLADLPWTHDSSGNNVVGRNKHGGKTLGDYNVFAVDYNYSAGYDAAFTRGGSDGQTICGVNGHAGGSFYADVQIPVIGSRAVIDAGLHARGGQAGDPTVYADGHLSVFGVSLYSSGGEVSAPSFNLSPADPNRMNQNLGSDWVIMVSFVPIHVHAGVGFSTGLTWNVGGYAPQNCDSSGNGAPMTLTGNITPWANVSADLSAAVGVTLAGFGGEAGVRGELTLLQASLPVNLSLTVGDANIPNAGHYLSLILNTTSAIELSALSGSISAYAEVCYVFCESVEHEIFRWNGINLGHVDLFPALNEAFPLVVLKTATPPGSR